MPRIGQGATSGVLNARASANPHRIHAGRRTISVATTTGKRRNSNAVSRTKPVATRNDSSRMNNVASRTKPVAIQNGSSRNSSVLNSAVSGNSNGNSKTNSGNRNNSDNRSSNVVSRSARLNNSGAITTTSVDATKPIAGLKIRIGARKSSAARTTRIANGIGNSASKTSNEGISTGSAVRTMSSAV